MHWDVVVIGAGAAGLLAAARCSQRERRTLLLEKNKKLGVKILMSGGTRCNVTHDTDARGIVTAFGRNGPFLHSALAALGPAEIVELLRQLGVPTKTESTGKIFPCSDRALDVRDALVRFAQHAGCEISAPESVQSIQRIDGQFVIATAHRQITTSRLIMTVGGQSYPGCGTTGDGFVWARQLGHSVVPPRPALTPILTAGTWTHELSGLTIPDVELQLFDPSRPDRPIDRRRGSFLFTHFGISGPVALDISGSITAQANSRVLELRANFLPELKPDSFRQALPETARTDGKRRVVGELSTRLPKSLARALADRASISEELPVAECSRANWDRLCQQIFRSPLEIVGTKGFEHAEVTAGGVSLKEIDSRTMESKLVPGLFVAGEVLDLDGPIGGYNFQAAFSTGWLAGGHA